MQVESKTGTILRLRTSEKIMNPGAGTMTVLTNELDTLRKAYPMVGLTGEFRINLGTLLGMDALWDVGPVYASDGRTVIGQKVKSSGASPKVAVRGVEFNQANVVLHVVGEHGTESTVELSAELIPVRVTKAGFPMPAVATNSVFVVETNGIKRVF